MSNGLIIDWTGTSGTSRAVACKHLSKAQPYPASRPRIQHFFLVGFTRASSHKRQSSHPHITPTDHCDFPRQRIFEGLWVSITHTMPLRFTCGSTPSVTFLINTPSVFLGPSLAFLLACTFGITEIKPCLCLIPTQALTNLVKWRNWFWANLSSCSSLSIISTSKGKIRC